MAHFLITKRTFVLVFACLIFCKVYGQSSNAAYKQLKREAEAYFIDEIFKSALPLFLQLQQFNPDDPELNYKTGVCYLHSPYKGKAIQHFEKAKLKDKINTYSDIDYYLGVSYHYNHEFDKAIDYYQKYTLALDTLSDYGKLILPTVKKYIQNCQVGKLLIANPTNSKIEHLNTNVNTIYSETYPLLSQDGNILYFSSQRHESTGGKIDDETDEFFEDIYFSKKVNAHWSQSKHIGQINTFKHDAPLCLSADGKRIYFYTTDENNSSDIYYSDYNGTEWSLPQNMGSNINSTSGEFGASITADGKTFYFSSNRPGGFGGMDIYVSKLGSDGLWGPATNIGPLLNTSFDEESPSILPNGKTLFFSSDGPNSIGGLDIFKTDFQPQDSSWSRPLNMGYPLNTAEHEYQVSWGADGKSGYFSSFRKDSYGEEDIYYAEVVDEEPAVKVFAKVEDPNSVPVVKTYAKPDLGETLKQIAFFDFNIYSEPAAFSLNQLQEVVDIMNKYPELFLEVGGHTDSIGSYAINKLISDKRATTIFKYLIAHGVESKRLKKKGYAFHKLVINGKSTLENGPNRRVEFKIINKDEIAAEPKKSMESHKKVASTTVQKSKKVVKGKSIPKATKVGSNTSNNQKDIAKTVAVKKTHTANNSSIQKIKSVKQPEKSTTSKPTEGY